MTEVLIRFRMVANHLLCQLLTDLVAQQRVLSLDVLFDLHTPIYTMPPAHKPPIVVKRNGQQVIRVFSLTDDGDHSLETIRVNQEKVPPPSFPWRSPSTLVPFP